MAGMQGAGRVVALAAAAALTAATPGLAQSPMMPMSPMSPMAPAAQMPQVPLNKTIIESFIASYPTVKTTADAVSKKYNIKTQGAQASGWGAWMGASGAWGEMNAVVKPFGFDTFQTWLNATISIAMAFAFAKDGGQMDKQMADAMAKVQSDPNIPPAQKQMIMQQIQASAGSMGAIKPPQANLDAVKPYLAQLTPLLGK